MRFIIYNVLCFRDVSGKVICKKNLIKISDTILLIFFLERHTSALFKIRFQNDEQQLIVPKKIIIIYDHSKQLTQTTKKNNKFHCAQEIPNK